MAEAFEHYWVEEKQRPEVLQAFRQAHYDDWSLFPFLSVESLRDDISPLILRSPAVKAGAEADYWTALRDGIRLYAADAESAPALLDFIEHRLQRAAQRAAAPVSPAHARPQLLHGAAVPSPGAAARAAQPPQASPAAAAAAAGSASPPSPFAAVPRTDVFAPRIHAVLERPPFQPGDGGRGLAATDPASFAEARAQLVLLAVQLHPLLDGAAPALGLPADLTLSVLEESDPKEASRPGEVAVHLRPVKGRPANTYRLSVPVRSKTNLSLLEPHEALKLALRGLALAVPSVGGSWEAAEAWAKRAVEEYRTNPRLVGQVPVATGGLVLMGMLPAEWREQYSRHVRPATAPVAAAGGSAGFRPKDREGTGGSAVSLWWPARLADVKHYPTVKAQAVAAKAAEQQQTQLSARELRLQAIARRMQAGAGGLNPEDGPA